MCACVCLCQCARLSVCVCLCLSGMLARSRRIHWPHTFTSTRRFPGASSFTRSAYLRGATEGLYEQVLHWTTHFTFSHKSRYTRARGLFRALADKAMRLAQLASDSPPPASLTHTHTHTLSLSRQILKRGCRAVRSDDDGAGDENEDDDKSGGGEIVFQCPVFREVRAGKECVFVSFSATLPISVLRVGPFS